MNAEEKAVVLADLAQREQKLKAERALLTEYTRSLLKNTNITGDEIAGALGISRSQVYNRIAAVDAPVDEDES